MSGSITTFPIATNYIRDLTATQFPAPDDVIAIDGPTNGSRGLNSSYLTQLSATTLPANGPVFDGTEGRATATTALTTTTLPVWIAGRKNITSLATTEDFFMTGQDTAAGQLIVQVNAGVWRIALRANSSDYAIGTAGAATLGNHRFLAGIDSANTPYLWVDGVQQTVTTTTNGAASWSVARNLASIDIGGGIAGWASLGYCLVEGVGLGTWSASDTSTYFSTGALPPWTQAGGLAGVNQVTGDSSTFTTTAGNWTAWASGSSVAASSGQGNFTCDGAYHGGGYALAAYLAQNALKYGANYRLEMDVISLSAPIVVTDGNTYIQLIPSVTTAGHVSADFQYLGAVTQLGLASSASLATFTIDNFTLTPFGTVAGMDPTQEAAGDFNWRNSAGAKNPASDFVMPASGWTPLLPNGPRYSVRGRTNTNGNQQLNGQVVVNVGNAFSAIYAYADGAATIQVGNVSGGAQIVASTVLTVGAWQKLAIVSGAEVATTQNLWVNSNSTANVDFKFVVERM